ncbi:MAG: DUF2071 domain-containing protein [Actinobacteria bacterium]|nr:DUF2071 domain-containing protein [Actinomycetota bacterium]
MLLSRSWSLTDALQAPARQAATLEEIEHRPWPLVDQSWAMGQTWDELLFAHWRVPADPLRSQLPAGLELDLLDGEAWLGVTAFRLTSLRARGLPPLPFASAFLELNTRTYVTADDKPGIWFFSLDAESGIAVEGARRGYKLPYFRADMRAVWGDGWLLYESRRRDGRGAPGAFRARYRADGEVFNAERGSLAHFLTERYCLYATGGDGRLYRAEIHHRPWPLQSAELELEENTVTPRGVDLLDEAPFLHYSERQDVLIWALEPAV